MDLLNKWKLSLLFSFVSYSIVLFGIIILDVFWIRDFDFQKVSMITGIYMAFIILVMIIEFIVFKTKLDSRGE